MPEIAALIAAASLGAMLFFSAVVAPTVFGVVQEADAGRLLRALFPKYFVVNGGAAIAAGILSLQPIIGAALVLSGIAMIAVRIYLIPMINDARDAMTGGNKNAKSRFDRLHRVSVIVNVLEMVVLVAAIYFLLA